MPHHSTSEEPGLDRIADRDGFLAIIAMDQRNTLRRMFQAVGQEPSDADLYDAKGAVAAALSTDASGILFDPTYGVPAAQTPGVLAAGCGLLVAAEPAERLRSDGEPRCHRDPDLNGNWVRGLGGDAVKFFVQLRADRPYTSGRPDLAEEALQVVADVVADAHAAGLPAVIENLIYPLPGEDLTPQRREDAIIEAASALNEIDGIDLLKLEYPGSVTGARRLAAVLDRPWAILSAGVPFDQFTRVLEIAFDEGGASGFIAGRSVWKESIGLTGAERDHFLAEIARPRLQRLVEVAANRATPWQKIVRTEARHG